MLALHAVEQLEAQSAAHATPIGVALRTVVLVKRDVVLRGDEDIGKRKKVNVELEREVYGGYSVVLHSASCRQLEEGHLLECLCMYRRRWQRQQKHYCTNQFLHNNVVYS